MRIWIPKLGAGVNLGSLELDEVETALVWSIDGIATNQQIIARSGHDSERAQKALFQLFVKGVITRGDAPDKTAPALSRDTWSAVPLDLVGEPVAPELARDLDAAEVISTQQLDAAEQEFEDCQSVPTLQLSAAQREAATAIGDDESVRTVQLAEPDSSEDQPTIEDPVGVPTVSSDWGAAFAAAEQPELHELEAEVATDRVSAADVPAAARATLDDAPTGGFGAASVASTVVQGDDSLEDMPTAADRSPFSAPRTEIDGITGSGTVQGEDREFPQDHEVKTVKQRAGRAAASVLDTLPEDE